VSSLRSLSLVMACLASCAPAWAVRRPLEPADYQRFNAVSAPQVAPDGSAVVYLVTTADRETDAPVHTVWTANWAGTEHQALTHGGSASEPRFRPDGLAISYLAARPADATTQLWLVDRKGGEPRALTHVAGEISAYEWSPDGRQIVLLMTAAEDTGTGGAAKTPRPIVIDGFVFKVDYEGYRTPASYHHLYLLDVERGTLAPLSVDPRYDDRSPAFSPDGRHIAFVSNHRDDAERSGIDEIYLIDAYTGASARRLAQAWTPTYPQLAWSPDGTRIAFLIGGEPRFSSYISDRLATVDVATGVVQRFTDPIDRPASSPVFVDQGRAIEFILEDDRYSYVAKVELASGSIERVTPGPAVVDELAGGGGKVAAIAADDARPHEIYALEDRLLRPITSHNDALFAELSLGTVEDLSFRSRDGTEIHGVLVKPPDFVAGRRYPTIAWLHGGPQIQDDHSLSLKAYGPALERQLFAGHGYAVLGVNYRGTPGRGDGFARAIAGDWAHKEVEDVIAGIDAVIARGIADPDRLGIGGWSYGGILTDAVIARDGRFKAAISGAGSGNVLAQYGADQYALTTDAEYGPPSRNPKRWLRTAFPLLHANRIRTPTLFMGGERDVNVPIAGSEQMYMALRSLGIPTELVIYPDQYHEPQRPSYRQDRAERYLSWMGRFMQAPPRAPSPPGRAPLP
jgi:dipeptidyl aminopeptidase/acylaminoacyl peptidase